MAAFLVTGAAGSIGREVAQRLVQAGAAPRLLVRTLDPARHIEQAAYVQGDFEDLPSMAQAFAGVDSVFLYTPARFDPRLLQSAKAQGVRRIVLLSSAAVVRVAPEQRNPVAERHRSIEQAIQDFGFEWTFLRPDILASNCLAWAPEIQRESRVRVPFPDAMRNPIHEKDVAQAAVQALRTDQLRDAALALTGPRSLTLRRMVEIIAEEIRHPIACEAISPEHALRDMTTGPRAIKPEIAARLIDYQRKSVSTPPQVSPDFEQACGRPPREFSEWVRDHRQRFLPVQRTMSGDAAP